MHLPPIGASDIDICREHDLLQTGAESRMCKNDPRMTKYRGVFFEVMIR